MANNQTNRSDIECKFFESASDVPDPRGLSPEKKNLMVFDDLLPTVRETEQVRSSLYERSPF